MTRHLLLIHLGPVQDFIAQARRTRDLWLGSRLLGEVSKAVARSLAAHPGTTLIFPPFDTGDPRLVPADGSRDSAGQLAANVANKILALVEGDPQTLATGTRAAAQQYLRDQWQAVLKDHSSLVDPAAHAAAAEQLETFLEFYAVMTPCPDDAGYGDARNRLEAELAARKTLHDFAPWRQQRGSVEKSSLDGTRETVLPIHKSSHETRRSRADRLGPDFLRYRIGLREELDAIGLIKRTRGRPEQFVPLPTLGLSAWIATAKERPALDALDALKNACGSAGLVAIHRPEFTWLEPFPFDAQVLLPDRLALYLRENAPKAEIGSFLPALRTLHKELGEPRPYVACLVADGDHMGRTIHHLASQGHEAHRRFSQRLAAFAGESRNIVEKHHRGMLVYAGGDDLLAFVCLPDALACATELREAFQRCMDEALLAEVSKPTLSIGLGIGHVLESLGDLLAWGREADHIAKREGRDRLAILVEKHAGARLTWSAPWSEAPSKRIADDIEALTRGTPSAKKVQEIAALWRRLPEPAAEDTDALAWRQLLEGETHRILRRNQAGGEPLALDPSHVGLDLDLYDTYPKAYQQLDRWTQRLQLAQFLSRALPRTALPATPGHKP